MRNNIRNVLTKKRKILYISILFFLLIALALSVFLINRQTNTLSNAASIATIEPENGVLSGNVSVINDQGVSGGKYVRFAYVYGPKQITCTGIAINPGEDIQEKIDANPAPGTTFCFKPGIHRLSNMILGKEGHIYQGELGAIISGAQDISNIFVQEGTHWIASNMTMESAPAPALTQTSPEPCSPKGPLCRYNEDVYLDDNVLQRVANASEVTSGKFYFDYPNDKIYIGDNPTGRKIEVATTNKFIKGYQSGINHITIKNLVVEKFATPFQQGAIEAREWTIENNESRYNHGVGILGGATVRNNYVHHNGELGIGGSATLVENNKISHNNTAGFAWGNEGGGSKWTHATDLTVRNNYVHDNNGPGLWCDGDCYAITYENNRIENNVGPGIDHEISYDAIIKNNSLKNNSIDAKGKSIYWGANIYLGASYGHTNPIEIYGNIIDASQGGNGIGLNNVVRTETGRFGGYEIKNIKAYNNTFKMSQGSTGVTNEKPPQNIQFTSNTYFLGTNEPYFQWNGPKTSTQWKSLGNDATGTFHQL